MRVITKDGYLRIVWPTYVLWYADGRSPVHTYAVARFPFVPDYHLCAFVKDQPRSITPYPMQQFKTLTQALAVLKVIVGSQS